MNSKKSAYKVAIIGAGQIGSGFDTPDSARVLTHAHAFFKDARTELIAIVDTDRRVGEKEAGKWGTRFFADIDEMFSSAEPDIVVIATPDTTHAELLERAAHSAARLIICEKPVAVGAAQAARVRALDIRIPVIVNFGRRFDTAIAGIARDIEGGTFGSVICASGIYDRGIFNNGSHVLDLARMFFGEMESALPFLSIDDLPGGTASVSGVATFERCPEFFLMHGDGRRYFLFEFDIRLERGRVRFTNNGSTIEMQDVADDPVYAGLKLLGAPRVQKTGLDDAFSDLAAHSVAVLDGEEEPRSTLDNALKTHEACMRFAAGMKTS